MSTELDHIFVCTDPGAPAAEELVRFGLREGPPNTHPGQGTACRRFAFFNAMLELFWVCDEAEAQNEGTRRTQLWERWSHRESGASPFGVCLRPADPEKAKPPFPAWRYQPIYLSDPLAMYIAETGVEEPMWVFLGFLRRTDREHWFVEHPIGIREITGVTLTTPAALRSAASTVAVENGVLCIREGAKHLLEIEFDGKRRGQTADFRPHLPLIFRF
ncbi:glyoxalase-like protein [Edaphobacter aggregans]|uniref:Glyoxalase-like protein n=1 Tax=Edaphobacter aggregans TaxID=570835 RepID=A0A428MMB7_9BACT|nr:VOC family protein [Edaphobacter aggregans]RSL18036.1 glyoxalase-like protein [Edaphobacter aggregans]